MVNSSGYTNEFNSSGYTNEFNTLNASITAIINKLKNQNKREDTDSKHKQLIKTNIMHVLETEGKIVNKFNRNKDSFHVSRDMVDAFAENILEKTPIRFHDRSFDTPTLNQTDFQSLSNSSYRKS